MASACRWLFLTFGSALLVNALASRSAQAQAACDSGPYEISSMELVSVQVAGVDKTTDFVGYRDWDWELVSTERGWLVRVLDAKRIEVEQEYIRE